MLILAGTSACLIASASAQNVDCTTLPNAVHGIGGSAGTPFIRNLAKALAAGGDDTTVVYADTGACDAMTWLVVKPNDGLTKGAKYWNASTGVEGTCSYPSGSTQLADWGSMAQEATTCGGVATKPATLGDQLGPNSGFSLIAPQASSNFAITAEAVYFIYGFGPGTGHDVGPWKTPASIGSRTTTSAAGLLLAKAVGLPPSRPLFGSNITARPQQDVKTNQGAIDYITGVEPAALADPESALAFCSTETVESGTNRSKVRTLAFQAIDQQVAYFPDSTDTATDKKNLREGRYFLWGPHHFYLRLKDGAPVNPRAAKLGDYFTGKAPLPGSKTFLDVTIETGVIPQCAMHVTRSDDMGPLASYQPGQPCGCFYDDKKGFKHDCTPCTAADGEADDACPDTAPVCRHKFCEVK